MNALFCDRCGSRIDGRPLGMHFAYGNDLSPDMRRIEKMDFCEECMAEIVDFTLHKNACDECVQQMMEENTMLLEADSDGYDRDISKYRKAIEKYGVPKQCTNIPVSSFGDGSEDI